MIPRRLALCAAAAAIVAAAGCNAVHGLGADLQEASLRVGDALDRGPLSD